MIFEAKKSFELVTAMACRADARTPILSRRNYEVCTIEYVTAGAGYVELNGRAPVRVESGGVYFLPKHSDHVYYPDRGDPWHKLFFVADGPLMEDLMGYYGLLDCTAIPAAHTLRRFFTEFIHLRNNSVTVATPGAAALLFHEFAIACCGLLSERRNGADSPVRALRTALETDLSEAFVLEEYAEQVKRTPEHLIRIFRREFGETPGAYRLRLRLNEAERLLAYSELSVKEIAAALGFVDQYYFSNCFKRRCGEAPSVFRRTRNGAPENARNQASNH